MLPQVPGIPWWGAVAVATVLTVIGFAYDAGSGDKTLSGVFSVFYIAGCLLAVLAVRQSGVFSAVIQPPLILFVMVPTAYFVFHGSKVTGVKDTLINCGYPLIERFPLMFFTSAAVLLVGMARWYLGTSARRALPQDAEAAAPAADTKAADGALAAAAAAITAKASARRVRKHSIDRPTRAAAVEDEDVQRPARKPRTTGGTARAPRSRHARPPETELIEPVVSRPRRPRPAAPQVDPPAEPRRRTRAAQPRDAREPREPREAREPRVPRERRNGPPVEPRGTRDRGERSERSDRYERGERPERRRRTSDYDPYDLRPGSTVNGTKGTNGTGSHHPVSRVRYRGADDGEARSENRTRPRRTRNPEADSWQ